MYLQLQGLMQPEHYDRRKQESDGSFTVKALFL